MNTLARGDVFALRNLDLILTDYDVKMRHPTLFTRTGCSITPRTSHVPAGLAAQVISRKRDVWRCGATIFGWSY